MPRSSDTELERADADFVHTLGRVGLKHVMTWAHLIPKKRLQDAETFLHSLMVELGAGERAEAWTSQALRLWAAARGEGSEIAKRVGSLSGLEISQTQGKTAVSAAASWCCLRTSAM